MSGVKEMRAFVITLAGAVGGAALAVAVILVMAQNGMMPINDIGRPQLNARLWRKVARFQAVRTDSERLRPQRPDNEPWSLALGFGSSIDGSGTSWFPTRKGERNAHWSAVWHGHSVFAHGGNWRWLVA
jgi:hypothetical protein